ncbi:hypothetical protein BZA77DRAFT_324018 [Pyronema omphalodes]|nr:hypothetical protein BZA77DRAFT_324018 [Pyronema omphalodes]
MADLPPSYAPAQEVCIKCSQNLLFPPPAADSSSKSDITNPIKQRCCGLWVCSSCIDNNPRLANYCPYCPDSGLLPPTYAPAIGTPSSRLEPPPDDPSANPPSYGSPDLESQDPPQNLNQVLQERSALPSYGSPDTSPQHSPPALNPPLETSATPPSYGDSGSQHPSPIEPSSSTPPSYGASSTRQQHNPIEAVASNSTPPSYGASSSQQPQSSSSFTPPEYVEKPKDDTLHFVKPTDTLPGLAAAYGVSPDLLRVRNGISEDAHLAARQAIAIPEGGDSQSPAPLEGQEIESTRRRFQSMTNCDDTEMAEAYILSHDGVLEKAIEAWTEDERWVREQEERERKGKGIVSGRGIMLP